MPQVHDSKTGRFTSGSGASNGRAITSNGKVVAGAAAPQREKVYVNGLNSQVIDRFSVEANGRKARTGSYKGYPDMKKEYGEGKKYWVDITTPGVMGAPTRVHVNSIPEAKKTIIEWLSYGTQK